MCEYIFLVKEVCSFYRILKRSFDDDVYDGGDGGGSDANHFKPLAYEMAFCLDLLQRLREAVHRR